MIFMVDVNRMKDRIVELIDENKRNGPKIAFYSDPRVSSIMEQLYSRLEANNRSGKPLDYASEEELKFLYNMALKYSDISDEEAWLIYMSREATDVNPTFEEIRVEEQEKKSIWRKIFWFLIPG
jgi:hypothetical protein